MIAATPFLLAWGFSGWELAVLLVLGLLIFGGDRNRGEQFGQFLDFRWLLPAVGTSRW